MPPEIKRLKPALNITGCLALMHAIHLAQAQDKTAEDLNRRVRSMADISMEVTSIDSLAPYTVSPT